MSGICGIATAKVTQQHKALFTAMLESLSYGRSKSKESAHQSNIIMGCSYVGQAKKSEGKVYQTEKAAVCFYGYLFTPSLAGLGSKSEAQYVHDLYLNAGEGFIGDLDGSFVLVVFDKLEGTLLVCNSRFGASPLYYAMSGKDLIFSSEVKALLQDTTLPRYLDDFAVADFFGFGRILGDKTFFKEIRSLPFGSVLKYQSGNYSIKQYWDMVFPETYPQKPDKYWEGLIYEAVNEAVDGVIEPDKRYGLLLSGGRDSRWLAALLTERCPKIWAFTHVTPGSKDGELAKEVAERVRAEHFCFPLTPAYYTEHSDRIAYTLDGMINVRECFALQEVMNAPNYVDVVIAGFLGGELFGKSRPVSYRGIGEPLEYLSHRGGDLLSNNEMDSLFGKEMMARATQSLQESLKDVKSNIPESVIEHHKLRSQQNYGLMMAESAWAPYVHVRNPFLARQVIEVALQLPPRQKAYEQAYSRSLCSHFPALSEFPFFRPTALPSSATSLAMAGFRLTNLAQRLPLLKKAFPTPKLPFADWLRGPLKPLVEQLLLGKEANQLELFNKQYLKTLIDDHMRGERDLNFFIFLLLTFELWCKLFYYPSVPKLPESMR